MTDRFGPGAALDPSTFYRCYLSGLTRDAASERLATCFVLLAMGRLGLRPGEIQHLHEAWIDWGRGELYVPARDPCACEHCWEAARVAQREGDGRDLADIVAEDCWSPPAGGERTISFGWSRRVTAVLATALDTWTVFDRGVDEMLELCREAARISGAVDPAAVTVASMRASAAQFYADAGFDAEAVATLFGAPVEKAARFVDASVVGSDRDRAAAPGLADDDPEYALLAASTQLEREPVDPRNYDADWRTAREADREPRPTGSPRAVTIPDAVDYTPPTDAMASYHDRWRNADTIPPGPDSLAAWVEQGPSGGSDPSATGSGGPGVGGADAGAGTAASDGLPLQVPARFVCETVQDGRPAGGTALLGQDELVLVTHGDGRTVHHAVVPIHAVADVALDYCPEPLERVFDETLAVAYRLDDERRVAIVELPPADRRTVATALFEGRLDDVDVRLSRPGVEGVDAGPAERGVLSVADRRLVVSPDPGAEPTLFLSLDDVVRAERTDQAVDGETVTGLTLEHLTNSGHTRTVRLGVVDADARTVLARYVMRDYRRRERRVAAMNLDATELEVLETVEADGSTGDLSTVLDRDGTELASVVDALAAADLVRQTDGRTKLTGLGQMLLDDVSH